MMRPRRPASGALLGDAMLVGAALIWGVNVSIIALMLRHVGPVALSVSRMAAGALVLLALTRAAGGSLGISRRDVPLLLAAGLLTLVDQLAFTVALTTVNPATASLLFATTPLMVMLLSAALGWTALSRRHWSAAGLGLAGVSTIVAYGQHISFHNIVGDLEVLGSALAAAAYTLVLKPLSRNYSAPRVLAYVFAIAATGGACGGFGQLTTQHWARVPASTWAEFAGSVAMSTVAANALYIAGVKRLGPVRATMYTNLEPVFGVIAAGIILAVRLSLIELGGGLLIILSLIVEPSRPAAAEPT
jgi:drug/metabolite transporter (DMT)-like permease